MEVDDLGMVWKDSLSMERSNRFPPLDSRWMRDVHDHVLLRIGETPAQTDPFPHLYARDVFPADFYANLVDQLPEDDRYKPSRLHMRPG